jgi:DNA end-binding protein Ku
MEHTVERADIVKGYEYEKGKYAIIEPAELKNLRLAGKKTIEVSQFSRASEIDPALFEKPYFVMPKAGPQATAFAVIRKSLRESGMVGLGEIVFSGRQHLMALAPPLDPNQPGMMLYTLRFAAELRNARDYSSNVEDVKADAAQLKLAKQLIDAYSQPFEPSAFKDHYEEALRELVEAKINNLPIAEEPVEKKQGKVIDLMEALRKSLQEKKPVQAVDEQARAETSSSASGAKASKTNASSKATTAGAKSQSAAPPQAPARKKARSA